MNSNIKTAFVSVSKPSDLCRVALGLFTLCSIICLPAIADNSNIEGQMNSPSGSAVYGVNFFEQYQPQNALEMVERLPGFSFDEGDDSRGFGGNAGNVLIDGVRPTSKSGGLRAALIRIPAEQVTHIEVMRGGVMASEAVGQTIVANVIRLKSDGNNSSGTWALKGRQSKHLNMMPNIEGALTIQLGQWDTSFDIDIGENAEYRTALLEFRDGSEHLTRAADEVFIADNKWANFNGEGSTDWAEGKLTLNGRFAASKWWARAIRQIYLEQLPDTSGHDQNWANRERDRTRTAELGIDWTRTRNDWKLKLIGLGTVEDYSYHSRFHFDQVDDPTDSNRFDSFFSQDKRKNEYIVRATYGLVSTAAFKPTFGIEVANNRLGTGLEFIENDTPVTLDSGNVTVTEWRGELFATFVYDVTSDWSMEGGITTELSNISVTGDANKSQRFSFLKPRIAATYHVNDDIDVTFEALKFVGQLNFSDFAASNRTTDDRTVAGNPDLSPDHSTDVKLTFDWGFSERGSVKVELFHEWREDILEQVILSQDEDGNISQGTGNAGEARYWGSSLALNLPLDGLIDNGLLELEYTFIDSQFDDPIISGDRQVNGYTPNLFELRFRQDLIEQKWAWGFEYDGNFTETYHNVDEKLFFSGNKRLLVFVETTAFLGIKTQFEITNVNVGKYTRERLFYEPSRGGEFIGREVAHRRREPEFKLSFSGTF